MFHHQGGDRHYTGAKKVIAPFTTGVPVTVGPSGNVIAFSHSFWQLKSYDFWLQIESGRIDGAYEDTWVDLIGLTSPYMRFDPLEFKGDFVPRGGKASKVYKISGLPPGARIRVATSHLDGDRHRGKTGAWGATLMADHLNTSIPKAVPAPAPVPAPRPQYLPE